MKQNECRSRNLLMTISETAIEFNRPPTHQTPTHTDHLLTDLPTHRHTDPVMIEPTYKNLFKGLDSGTIFILQSTNTVGKM